MSEYIDIRLLYESNAPLEIAESKIFSYTKSNPTDVRAQELRVKLKEFISDFDRLIKDRTPKENLPYGRCPVCGAKGVSRERRINGNDMCERGHTYTSREART
jgi:hypothetical protein